MTGRIGRRRAPPISLDLIGRVRTGLASDRPSSWSHSIARERPRRMQLRLILSMASRMRSIIAGATLLVALGTFGHAPLLHAGRGGQPPAQPPAQPPGQTQ